jgi:hypothetical protein
MSYWNPSKWTENDEHEASLALARLKKQLNTGQVQQDSDYGARLRKVPVSTPSRRDTVAPRPWEFVVSWGDQQGSCYRCGRRGHVMTIDAKRAWQPPIDCNYCHLASAVDANDERQNAQQFVDIFARRAASVGMSLAEFLGRTRRRGDLLYQINAAAIEAEVVGVSTGEIALHASVNNSTASRWRNPSNRLDLLRVFSIGSPSAPVSSLGRGASSKRSAGVAGSHSRDPRKTEAGGSSSTPATRRTRRKWHRLSRK